MSDLTANMTEAHLDAVMQALPDNMDEAELCALTLTIFATYKDSPADVMSALIAAAYTFGASVGWDSRTVSMGLRKTADLHDAGKPATRH